MPPGRNIKQQLAVKKTVSKWKRNVGGGGANTANGNAATAAAGQSPTSAQNQNFRNGGKKQSMVIAKNPQGTRNLNVRNEGGAQGNYYNRSFVWNRLKTVQNHFIQYSHLIIIIIKLFNFWIKRSFSAGGFLLKAIRSQTRCIFLGMSTITHEWISFNNMVFIRRTADIYRDGNLEDTAKILHCV